MQVCVTQTKTSIKEKHPGCLKGVGWLLGFFNRNTAFYYCSLQQEHCFSAGCSLMPRPVVYQEFIAGVWSVHPCLSVLLSGALQGQVGSSWWQWGHRPGDVAWKHLFLPISDRSTFPLSLEIYSIKFSVLSKGSEQREICRRFVWGKGSYLDYISARKNKMLNLAWTNRCGSFPGYWWHISSMIFQEVKGEAGAIWGTICLLLTVAETDEAGERSVGPSVPHFNTSPCSCPPAPAPLLFAGCPVHISKASLGEQLHWCCAGDLCYGHTFPDYFYLQMHKKCRIN